MRMVKVRILPPQPISPLKIAVLPVLAGSIPIFQNFFAASMRDFSGLDVDRGRLSWAPGEQEQEAAAAISDRQATMAEGTVYACRDHS